MALEVRAKRFCDSHNAVCVEYDNTAIEVYEQVTCLREGILLQGWVASAHDIEVGEDVTLLGADGPAQLLVIGIMAEEGPARQAQVIMPLEVSQEVFARGAMSMPLTSSPRRRLPTQRAVLIN